ncbi:hypothetical protein PLICRDRAFT_48952 [Plicaturopsis crispa FD-325 SS-3]|nr:hypothetical protein PLICRDRAFT_48952 [Plicaturopsis crispa FD-325 SS-3]
MRPKANVWLRRSDDALPNPWEETPLPVAAVPADHPKYFECALQGFRLRYLKDPGLPLYPYRVPPKAWCQKNVPNFTDTSAAADNWVLYHEFRGNAPPPDNVGHPGDIWWSMSRQTAGIWVRGLQDWVDCSGENRIMAWPNHPHVSTHRLLLRDVPAHGHLKLTSGVGVKVKFPPQIRHIHDLVIALAKKHERVQPKRREYSDNEQSPLDSHRQLANSAAEGEATRSTRRQGLRPRHKPGPSQAREPGRSLPVRRINGDNESHSFIATDSAAQVVNTPGRVRSESTTITAQEKDELDNSSSDELDAFSAVGRDTPPLDGEGDAAGALSDEGPPPAKRLRMYSQSEGRGMTPAVQANNLSVKQLLRQAEKVAEADAAEHRRLTSALRQLNNELKDSRNATAALARALQDCERAAIASEAQDYAIQSLRKELEAKRQELAAERQEREAEHQERAAEREKTREILRELTAHYEDDV